MNAEATSGSGPEMTRVPWSAFSNNARPPWRSPGDVIDRRLRIVEVLQYALAPNEIYARVGERQRPGESIDECDVGYEVAFRSTRSDSPQTGIWLNARNPAHPAAAGAALRDQTGQLPT